MLYIDKKTPAAGQKGIVMDNIYLPLSDETPAAGRKGLFVQNSGRKIFLPLQEKGGAPTTGQKGFFVQIGDRKMFIPIYESGVPSGLVFYASGASLSQAETGQTFTMSGSGVTLATCEGIPGYQFSSESKLSFSDAELPSGGNPYTISLWAKADQSSWSESVLFMWGKLNGNGVGLAYCYDTAVRDVGGMGRDHTSPDNSIVQTELNHAALSYDGQNSRIYVNGALVSTQKIGRSFSLQQGVIGSTHTWSEYFSGFIGGIRVFDVALSDAEIAGLAQEWVKTPVQRAFIPIVTR